MTEKTEVSQAIKISNDALEELKNIKVEQNIGDDLGLRIGVKGGGCSGFSYILGFDEQKADDEVFEIEGIKILMTPSHGMYLMGMEVDYFADLNNRGFIFNNPNADETCGCGTSFSA